ncbi:hypothetical protein D3C80_1346220 [compost metagenome]
MVQHIPGLIHQISVGGRGIGYFGVCQIFNDAVRIDGRGDEPDHFTVIHYRMGKSQHISPCRFGLQRFADHSRLGLDHINRVIAFAEICAHQSSVTVSNRDALHINYKHVLEVTGILDLFLQPCINLSLQLITGA